MEKYEAYLEEQRRLGNRPPLNCEGDTLLTRLWCAEKEQEECARLYGVVFLVAVVTAVIAQVFEVLGWLN